MKVITDIREVSSTSVSELNDNSVSKETGSCLKGSFTTPPLLALASFGCATLIRIVCICAVWPRHI